MELFTLNSFVMGFHDYMENWTPTIGEILICVMEPDNAYDKYAVAVKKDGKLVGHLMKGTRGNFAKMVFYFLRRDSTSSCTCRITGKAVNQGKGMGLQVPCELTFNGKSNIISQLKTLISC